MLVLSNRTIGQSYRNHCVLRNAGRRHRQQDLKTKKRDKKNAAPLSRGRIHVSANYCKQQGRKWSSTSVAPKQFRSTFAVS
ncbi:hypothetical protein K788_0006439 [Paraburkholderia caribensis MBA4]|uniref:Uncharacterized protein n=1 Tax=Paraburkholderia caribensis MBA4 TaxID=1323664 RepID=A0A0P0RCE8_9BURK|nr:hypothetical protein K788_0006439 [Paraburkholderia caribensis MBA4]